MEKGVGFLVFIFIAGFVIYILTQVGTGGIKLGNNAPLFTFTSPAGLKVSVPNAAAPSQSVKIEYQGPGASTLSSQQKPVPPAGFSESQLSPFYGKVKINWARASYWDDEQSEFTISSNYQNTEVINITGWHLASNKSAYAAIIPQAVNDYNPNGVLYDSDIVIDSGTTVTMYSGASPNGKSFRLNKCTGYLNEQYKFNPQIPANCPASYERSEISTFNGSCQSFILSQYGCHTPTPDEINRAAGYQDASCRAYLDRFNFNSCYRLHSSESDFFSKEWRVWASQKTPFPFHKEHDRILLFDKSGLLVDQYIY